MGLVMRSNKSGIKFNGRSVYFSHDGYPKIKYKNKAYYVHKFVWEKENGKVPDGLTINHIDGDKMNWDISNLELLTQKENVRHAWRTGLCRPKKGQGHGRAVLDDMQVLTILTIPRNKKLGRGKPLYATDQELADMYGVSKTRINNIRRKKEWLHLVKLFE